MVVEVVLVEPRVTVFAAAPVPKFTVVAAASELTAMVPVPELAVIVPLVDVIASAQDPDCTVVALVEFVEPRVTVFTPAPDPRFTVVLAASELKAKVPVPEFMVTAALVPVIDTPPLPD